MWAEKTRALQESPSPSAQVGTTESSSLWAKQLLSSQHLVQYADSYCYSRDHTMQVNLQPPCRVFIHATSSVPIETPNVCS